MCIVLQLQKQGKLFCIDRRRACLIDSSLFVVLSETLNGEYCFGSLQEVNFFESLRTFVLYIVLETQCYELPRDFLPLKLQFTACLEIDYSPQLQTTNLDYHACLSTVPRRESKPGPRFCNSPRWTMIYDRPTTHAALRPALGKAAISFRQLTCERNVAFETLLCLD